MIISALKHTNTNHYIRIRPNTTASNSNRPLKSFQAASSSISTIANHRQLLIAARPSKSGLLPLHKDACRCGRASDEK